MPVTPIFCQKCGAKLKPSEAVWLEWDLRKGLSFEPIPTKYSQGEFPYGKDCARALRRAAAGRKVA